MASEAGANHPGLKDPPAPPPGEPPPTPTFRQRPSIRHIVFGNLAFALLASVYMFDLLPAWLCVVAFLIAAGVAITYTFDDEVKQWYIDGRAAEIEPFVASHDAAVAQASAEVKSTWKVPPSINAVAFPMLGLCVLVGGTFFLDLSTWLGDLHWLLRWPLALIGTAVGFLVVILLWGGANLQPARMKTAYAEIRAAEGESSRLSHHDQNDILIINQVASLQSLHRRIETYTLESALLSALSFSSFIAILISENGYAEQLARVFFPEIGWQPLDPPFPIPGFGAIDGIPFVPFDFLVDNVIGFIAFSLLACATSFLGVLVARLRFNDGYRDAESLMKAAERLNEKETAAIAADQPDKVEIYSSAIAGMLDKTIDLQRGLNFTVVHMRVSRDAGMLFFVITLCLCGLFFGRMIAAFIVALFFLTFLAGYFDHFARTLIRRRVFHEGSLASLLSSLRSKK